MKALLLILVAVVAVPTALAQEDEVIELDTTTIKGNTELPKYMYVVPWQDKKSEQSSERKLVLHNLYADVFDPALPDYIAPEQYQLIESEQPD